jgi:hypothetical protein
MCLAIPIKPKELELKRKKKTMFKIVSYAGETLLDNLGKPKLFATQEEAEACVFGMCIRVGYNLRGWYVKGAN